MERIENTDGILDEPTASTEAGGSGVGLSADEKKLKIEQIGRLIEARMDPCLELLGWTWDHVLPEDMTVGELREKIVAGVGPYLWNEQENLPTYLVQVFRGLRKEKLAAQEAFRQQQQHSVSARLTGMTYNVLSVIRSAFSQVRVA